MEVNTTDTCLIGYHIDIEIGIAQILVNTFHDALEQLLIGRLYGYIIQLLLKVIVTCILETQQTMGVDQVDNLTAQDIHIERFHEIGIGTRFETL